MIDIAKADKAEVLAALYNKSKMQDMGILNFRPEDMTKEQAQVYLDGGTHFDYLHGRVMKIDLSSDELDPRLYDRDNGQGAAYAALHGKGII